MSKVFEFEYCTVVGVTDGDTILVKIDRGFNDFSHKTVRVSGIDTPEISKRHATGGLKYKRQKIKGPDNSIEAEIEHGLEAKSYLVRTWLGLGVKLTTMKPKDPRGRYHAKVEGNPATDPKRTMIDLAKDLKQHGFAKREDYAL